MAEGRLWNWEDIVHLPEQEMPEIIDGKPYYRAAPRMRHSAAATEIIGELRSLQKGSLSGWWILSELDVRLSPQRVVRPDVCGYRKERLPELVEDWPLDLRPDWVCEILSSGTARYDRGTKSKAYADAGIPWYWLVDPQERTVEVLELQGGRWALHGCFGDGETLALPPFDGCEISISDLFGGKVTP